MKARPILHSLPSQSDSWPTSKRKCRCAGSTRVMRPPQSCKTAVTTQTALSKPPPTRILLIPPQRYRHQEVASSPVPLDKGPCCQTDDQTDDQTEVPQGIVHSRQRPCMPQARQPRGACRSLRARLAKGWTQRMDMSAMDILGIWQTEDVLLALLGQLFGRIGSEPSLFPSCGGSLCIRTR